MLAIRPPDYFPGVHFMALLAHADRYARYEADARLRVRVGAVRRVAEAVRVLTPRTSHTSRRRVALRMGELASQLLR